MKENINLDRKYVEALIRWYSQDNEDKLWLTRTEVGYILRSVGELPV